MADGPRKKIDPAAVAPTLTGIDALGETQPLPKLDLSEQEVEEGTRLGSRYRLQRLVGRGGMGKVYLATDEALGKDVALKFVTPELAGNSRGLQSLRDEVLLAQRVTHPNVCRTYDLEEVDGQWLVKMEYIAGETLAERLSDGPLEVEVAIKYARDIVAGLEAAHAQGVVHRDLKPQNVLVERKTGRVALMDFGLARAELAPGEASAGSSGTPEYMAPEQARADKVDARADLFSLGALLYHVLVGRVPFPEARALVLEGKPLAGKAPDPRAARPDLPLWLAKLISRLLELDPELRPASAHEVAVALEGPRRRWMWGVVAGMAIAAAAAVMYMRRPVERPEWHPRLRELPAWEENADMPSFSPDGTRIAYLSDRDGAWRIYVETIGAGAPNMNSSRAVTPPVLDGADLDPDLPHWSRDGKTILFVGSRDRGYRVALDGSPPVRVAERVSQIDECGVGKLALVHLSSPSCTACQNLVLRASEGSERSLLELPTQLGIDFLRCDATGTRIVYTQSPADSHKVQRPGETFLLPVAGGAPRKLVDEAREQNRFPAYPTFAPDGRSLVYASARGGPTNLWEVSVSGGAPVQITRGPGPDLAPGVSPDGTMLVYDSDATAVPIFAVSLDGPARRRRLAPSLDDAATLVATPEGNEVIASVTSRGKRTIVAVPVGDGDQRPLTDGETPALTPDGKELVYTIAGVATTRIAALKRADGSTRTLGELPGHVVDVRVGPDGVVHLERRLDQSHESWRIALAGGVPERDAPAPFVQLIPAPRGGWRVAIASKGDTIATGHIVPPGKPLDTPGLRTIAIRILVWDATGESFVYWDGTSIHRFRVATGEDHVLATEKDVQGLAIAPDGKALYLSAAVGHVRRQLIDNFADHPRPSLD